MKNRNIPLVAGGIMLALILAVMLFPNIFSPTNPYGLKTMMSYTDANGSFVIKTPPFEPSPRYPMGSDEMGRDILSLILYGTRLTIGMSLLIAVARFALSVPIGISSGLGSFTARTMINQFSLVFSALPALLISLIILKMGFFSSLFKEESMIAFIVVLSFVGWHESAGIISRRVEKLNTEAFIKGQRAIGKSDLSIALGNMLPHLANELLVMFFMEIARVLTMLMQLGVFSVFIGNLRIIVDSGFGRVVTANVTFEPEWSSMLGAARLHLRSAPWVVFYPALAFFISVLAFNLFGEGLKTHFSMRGARDRTGQYWKRSRNGFAAAGAAVAVLLAYNNVFIPDFDLETTRKSMEFEKTGQLISGSEEMAERAGQIASKLEEMGLSPVGGSFIHEYEMDEIQVPVLDVLSLEKDGKEIPFEAGTDYFADSFGRYNASGEVYDGRRLDYYHLRNNYEEFEAKWVLLGKRDYTSDDLDAIAGKLLKESNAVGVLFSGGDYDGRYSAVGESRGEKPVLSIGKDMENILAEGRGTLSYRQISKSNDGKGINILAKLRGKDSRIGEDVILIGLSYGYQYEPIKSGKIDFAFELIEQLERKNANRDRTIVFAFFDGTESGNVSGIRQFSEHLPFQQKRLTMYLDLTKIYTEGSGRVIYNSDMAPFTRYYGWGFDRKMQSSLEKKGYPLEHYTLDKETDSILYYENGFTTIIAGFEPDAESPADVEDFGNMIVENIVVNEY